MWPHTDFPRQKLFPSIVDMLLTGEDVEFQAALPASHRSGCSTAQAGEYTPTPVVLSRSRPWSPPSGPARLGPALFSLATSGRQSGFGASGSSRRANKVGRVPVVNQKAAILV